MGLRSRPRRAGPSLLSRAAILLTALAAPGCGDPLIEARIDNRRPFDPPSVYGEWWAATEGCSRRTGDRTRIRWYLASSIVADGKVARGRWSPPHDIVLVAGYEDDRRTVAHEMLHDLLRGDPGHGAPAWDACDLRF